MSEWRGKNQRGSNQMLRRKKVMEIYWIRMSHWKYKPIEHSFPTTHAKEIIAYLFGHLAEGYEVTCMKKMVV